MTSKQCLQDEEEPFEYHIQLCLNSNFQQLPSTSLTSLQLDARILVIVFDVEAILIGGHQVVFEECFKNTNEGQLVSRFSNEIGHCFWFQDPLNYLNRE